MFVKGFWPLFASLGIKTLSALSVVLNCAIIWLMDMYGLKLENACQAELHVSVCCHGVFIPVFMNVLKGGKQLRMKCAVTFNAFLLAIIISSLHELM